MADKKTTQDDIQITAAGGTKDDTAGTKQQGAQSAKKPVAQDPVVPQDMGKAKLPGSFDLEEEALLSGQTIAPPEKHNVPSLVQEKFPDLIELIKGTESMDDDERDYWLQILPIMTEDQISKFRDILVTEKQQLQKLDQEYEDELTRLNEKHMIEWKEFESKEQKAELESKEKKAEEEEKVNEEALLKRLQEF